MLFGHTAFIEAQLHKCNRQKNTRQTEHSHWHSYTQHRTRHGHHIRQTYDIKHKTYKYETSENWKQFLEPMKGLVE